jgi:hypothetical protein
MLGNARGLLHTTAGCKGEISYISDFQSELYERNPHAACTDALSTHRPTLESPFNVDCIGEYGRSLVEHSFNRNPVVSTRCWGGPGSRAQFPLASTYSPPARPLSRSLARSPTARLLAHPPWGRPGSSLQGHSISYPISLTMISGSLDPDTRLGY